MTLMWCLVHNSESYPTETTPPRCFKVIVVGNWKIDPPCRWVEMELHPKGSRVVGENAIVFENEGDLKALVIERDEKGDWPEWATKAVSSFLEVDEDGAPMGRKPNPKKLDELAQAQTDALAQASEARE